MASLSFFGRFHRLIFMLSIIWSMVRATQIGKLSHEPFDNSTGCTCYNADFPSCLTPRVDHPSLCTAAPCSGLVCSLDPDLITGVCVKTAMTNQFYTPIRIPNTTPPPKETFCAPGRVFPVLQPAWVGRKAGIRFFYHSTEKGAVWDQIQGTLVLNQPNQFQWTSVTPQQKSGSSSNSALAPNLNSSMVTYFGLNAILIGQNKTGETILNAAVNLKQCSYDSRTNMFTYKLGLIQNYLDSPEQILAVDSINVFIDSASNYENFYAVGSQVASISFTQTRVEGPDNQPVTAFGADLFFPTTSGVGVVQIVPTSQSAPNAYSYTVSASSNPFNMDENCYSVSMNNSVDQGIGDVKYVYAMCATSSGSTVYYSVLDDVSDMQFEPSAAYSAYPHVSTLDNPQYVNYVPPLSYATVKIGLQGNATYSYPFSYISLSPRPTSVGHFGNPYYVPGSATWSQDLLYDQTTELQFDYFPTNSDLPGTSFTQSDGACGVTATSDTSYDDFIHQNCYAMGPLQSIISQTLSNTLYIGGVFLALTSGEVETAEGLSIYQQTFYQLFMLWKCTGENVGFPQAQKQNCVQVALNGRGWLDFSYTSLAFTTSFLTSDVFGNVYISTAGKVLVLDESNLESTSPLTLTAFDDTPVVGPFAVDSRWDSDYTIGYGFSAAQTYTSGGKNPAAPFLYAFKVQSGTNVEVLTSDDGMQWCAMINDPTFGTSVFPLQVFPLNSNDPANVTAINPQTGMGGATAALVVYTASQSCALNEDDNNNGYCGESLYDDVSIPGVALCTMQGSNESCILCDTLLAIGKSTPPPTFLDDMLGFLKGWGKLEEAAVLTSLFTFT